LVVVLLLTGVIYQFVATKLDEYRYPARGEMVDVGGYTLHLYCTGEEGAPTVVMDSGIGGTVLDWQLVQPEVAQFAHVCTYDRGGMGWSDPGAQPRTSQQFVEELHALLGNAGVQGPYVLVGHSFGGTNVQLYASQYPDEVAGMVLVDSADENEPRDPRYARLADLQPSPVATKVLATIGISRLQTTPNPELPPELATEQAAISSRTRHLYEVADETSSLVESFNELYAAPMSLGDEPLIVLSAGSLQMPGLLQEPLDQFNEAHSEYQANLPRRSRNGKQIIAENSGHSIQYDQPDLVIDAIRQVVEAARNSSSI
jgi:pimeloyl-ACP methyl ester carboxylesterase